MSAYRTALLALVVVGASVASLPASATGGVDGDATSVSDAASATADATSATADSRSTVGAQSTPENGTDEDAANNSSFGGDISSFMQSSTAEVGGAVETGMWTAAYNDTDNRTVRVRLVERRTADLQEEVADLRERQQELLTEREAGNVSDAAYEARVGQIVGEINALEASLSATESRAREVNANVAEVADLRTETEDLAGPEIATVARNLSGVDNGTTAGPDVGNGEGVGNGANGSANGDGPQGGDNERSANATRTDQSA